MNHQTVLPDIAFAIKPSDVSPSGTSEESGSVTMEPLEMDSAASQASNTTSGSNSGSNKKIKTPLKLKKIGKKIGGAFQRINVAKWIDDLEQDQDLADQLDRINSDNADEQERKDICRQAMEACLTAMREHLLEFLAENPQATYEEWISQLHPDNINEKMDGLTHMPFIDHRFYVADSDHRILWNEHLNDLEDPTNLTPVRQFVEARSFNPKETTTKENNDDDNQQQQQQDDPFALRGDDTASTNQQQATVDKQHIGEPVDLLSM